MIVFAPSSVSNTRYICGQAIIWAVEKEAKKSIDNLSKFTHVNPDTFGLEGSDLDEKANRAIHALLTIFSLTYDTQQYLESILTEAIDDSVRDVAIEEANRQIDILSTHSLTEHVEVMEWKIESIDLYEIKFTGVGRADVSLEWGSGDNHAQMSADFPFEFHGSTSVANPLRPKVAEENLIVDISTWFE